MNHHLKLIIIPHYSAQIEARNYSELKNDNTVVKRRRGIKKPAAASTEDLSPISDDDEGSQAGECVGGDEKEEGDAEDSGDDPETLCPGLKLSFRRYNGPSSCEIVRGYCCKY